VNHMRPDFEGHRDVGLAGGGGEADRVVEQGLGRTSLDFCRRSAILAEPAGRLRPFAGREPTWLFRRTPKDRRGSATNGIAIARTGPSARCLWIEAAEGEWRRQQSLAKKQKARYALPHDQSRLPHRPDHERSVPGPFPPRRSARKISSASCLVTH
jgi:hypothetical protein